MPLSPGSQRGQYREVLSSYRFSGFCLHTILHNDSIQNSNVLLVIVEHISEAIANVIIGHFRNELLLIGDQPSLQGKETLKNFSSPHREGARGGVFKVDEIISDLYHNYLCL
ncbi:MAG: hypothetical protein OHK0047_27010 [Leptolyngbyaceae cyanobacterium]